jgi:twinkle protein
MDAANKKDENCICFDYYFKDELINVKYRIKKNFKLYKDAEKIFYNLDNIATEDTCVIVEGEFDVLSYLSAGVTYSVPNGFNLKGELNLDYIDNYYNYFESKETILLQLIMMKQGKKDKN